MQAAAIVDGQFAFTGENYLQLEPNGYIERLFEPKFQDVAYLASCWLRTNVTLSLYAGVTSLKAIVSTTEGVELIGLLAEVKQQMGDWSYLELPIDFQLIKEINEDYEKANNLKANEQTKFNVKLRVQADAQETIELDHIRFTPFAHDFQATVYQSHSGKPTAIIQANGLVTRTFYNRLQVEIASTQEDGVLEHLSITSRTGDVHLSLQPVSGFYERFDDFGVRSHWIFDDIAAWRTAPGQLWHKGATKNRLQAKLHLFDGNFNISSGAVRFYYALQTPAASLTIADFELSRPSTLPFATLKSSTHEEITPLPLAAELVVMFVEDYVWLWLDGVLLIEEQTQHTLGTKFALIAAGNVLIEDCFMLYRPELQLTYFNGFGEQTQLIELEDAQTALVSETLYDELGRDAINTKITRIKRSGTQPLLQYHTDFVTNKNPADELSVWHISVLKGKIDANNPEDQGFAYTRTKYAKNTLNEAVATGLAGAAYSIDGPFATKLSQQTDISFLKNLFPGRKGYRQQVEHLSNGSRRVAIFDEADNQVAQYIRVPGFDHLLSTYEYDENKRLVKILPPMYHEKVDTASKTTPYQSGVQHLSTAEKAMQQALGMHFKYDEHGNLIRKTTPDSGVVDYFYNKANQMRFMASAANETTRDVIFFDYDFQGQLSGTGFFNVSLSNAALTQSLENQTLANAQQYQLFDYSDEHYDPMARGRIKHCITYDVEQPLAEAVHFNSRQQVIAKGMLIATAQFEELIKERSETGQLRLLKYPFEVNGQQLHLLHSYNQLGQLVSLSTNLKQTLVNYSYHASGEVASAQYQPETAFNYTRSYQYNSPGFLQRLSDPFLTEDVSYAEKGYGQTGFGDGMVMQATFNATWPANADGRWFLLQAKMLPGNYSNICWKALKRRGYVADNGQPLKLLVREAETRLPLVCGGETAQRIAQLIASYQMPSYYGHRYAYGNHQELVKAKYFAEDNEQHTAPLQPKSFGVEIADLNIQQSLDIWQSLTQSGYILADQRRNSELELETVIGKRGKTFFQDATLRQHLKALNERFTIYVEPIKRLILTAISEERALTTAEFIEAYLEWQAVDESTFQSVYQQQSADGAQIAQMLLEKGFLSPSAEQSINATQVLAADFMTALQPYEELTPAIVKVLLQHFAYSLGESPFDVESYAIDANGNHHHFYTGFERYELNYRENTNQIEGILLGAAKTKYAMQHDMHGNVIAAQHKRIRRILYYPVTQRTMGIELNDGRTLRFYYDTRGERILKQVYNAAGEISHETQYLRDEQGRVMIDRRIKYANAAVITTEIVTAYIYGPKGLIGFMRNNTFYSVFTDHAGSVRLVVESGQVVAAYDYLPYGKLMRCYGKDPQAHIMFRFTGQEWDEETELYNFHARLYDPSIGRFYQPDPKSQYFSPYKYAGNSPISLTDPDGEFAWFLIPIIAIFAAGGAYLGGAAANNRWNPKDWDWKDPGTFIGIATGGIAGGLMPIGFAASAATIGVGATIGLSVGSAYLITAAANQNWNPLQWHWDRPETFNAMFQGFSAGAGIVGGVRIVHVFANKIFVASRIGRNVFLGISYATGAGMLYAGGVSANDGKLGFWQWDLSNPATWSGMINGFDSGMGMTLGFTEVARGLSKFAKNSKNLIKFTANKRSAFKAILKNSKDPLFKFTAAIVMAYFMGSAANGELDITRWSLASFSTYEGIFNGVFFGKDTTMMFKLSRNFKLKRTSTEMKAIPGKRAVDPWNGQFKLLGAKINKIIEQQFMKQYELLVYKKDGGAGSQHEIESQFKHDSAQWLKGESRPPADLEPYIKKQSTSTSQLMKWQAETQQLELKKRTIVPDRDATFLSCQKLQRRRRRAITERVCPIKKKPRHEDNTQNPTPTPIVPPLNIPIRSDFLGKKLQIIKENKKFKEFKLGDGTASMKEVLDAIKEGNVYTPLNRERDLSTPKKIKEYFNSVKIKTSYDKVFQETDKRTEPITSYKFKQSSNKQRTALAELVAYNKNNGVTDVYLIIDEVRPIRVRNPRGNDVLFEPQKGGKGTKQDPYTFTNKNIAYADTGLPPHLDRNLNIAERGRNDFGGVLKMIGGANGGLQAPVGGTGYMKALKEGNYDQKLKKKHADGKTVGEVFSNQLKRFINENIDKYQSKVGIFQTLPELITFILKEERPTPRGLGQIRPRSKRSLKDEEVNKENVKPPKGLTSGSNDLQFGPLKLIKALSVALLNYVPAWISTPSMEPAKISTKTVPPIYTKPTNSGPTLQEMGKHWYDNTDMTGNLTWAVLLVRKFTGYRPPVAIETNLDCKLYEAFEIQAGILVHEFMDHVLAQASSCGIVAVAFLTESSNLQTIIQVVQQLLAAGKMLAIPSYLCRQLVEKNIHKIAKAATLKQANKLLALLIADIPKLEQQFSVHFAANECPIDDISFPNFICDRNADNDVISQASFSSLRQNLLHDASRFEKYVRLK